MISVNYRDARPVYLQIKENVIRLIVTGALSAHEKLPSVRELAAELAINPNTIQRAYRELEADGYIYKTQGKGCFVAPRREAVVPAQALARFDEAAAKLLWAGVSREALIERLERLGREVASA